jgi:hypothetical protein
MTTQLITRNYNDLTFTFRDDGYFNMTTAAKHFGKELSNFVRSPTTLEYADALSLVENTKLEIIQTIPGNRYKVNCGTWAHPKLAVFFARWLDVRFAVWCDAMIEDILKGNAEVLITKPKESAVLALPQDYGTALRALADGWEREQASKVAVEKLTVQVKALVHEVSHYTINEFCTKARRYFSPTERGRLSYYAKGWCVSNGITLDKCEMEVNTRSYQGMSSVYIYPLESLEIALEIVNLNGR